MKFAAALAVCVFVAGCGWKPAPDTRRLLSIDEVTESIHTLNGKTVKVGGYLPTCGGLDCFLVSNEQAAAEFLRNAYDSNSEQEFPNALSIGHDAKFDQRAGPLARHYVVVTAKVNDVCRDIFRRVRCTDRAPDLIPLDITLASRRTTPHG